MVSGEKPGEERKRNPLAVRLFLIRIVTASTATATKLAFSSLPHLILLPLSPSPPPSQTEICRLCSPRLRLELADATFWILFQLRVSIASSYSLPCRSFRSLFFAFPTSRRCRIPATYPRATARTWAASAYNCALLDSYILNLSSIIVPLPIIVLHSLRSPPP
jgi:hypothetical protein